MDLTSLQRQDSPKKPFLNFIELLFSIQKSRPRLFGFGFRKKFGFLKRFQGQVVDKQDPWGYMYAKYGRETTISELQKIIGE